MFRGCSANRDALCIGLVGPRPPRVQCRTNSSASRATALKGGIITRRFTFHDLRAFYASRHKKVKGTLPDLHKNPGTTAKIYDRNTEVGRDAL